MLTSQEITRHLYLEVDNAEKVVDFLKKMLESHGEAAVIAWLQNLGQEDEWPRLVEYRNPVDNNKKLAS